MLLKAITVNSVLLQKQKDIFKTEAVFCLKPFTYLIKDYLKD